MYEEIWRGAISGALANFTEPRGEFTLVIEGITGERARPGDGALLGRVAEVIARGESERDAIASVAQESGVAKRELYRLWHLESEK
jgi:16S rRNA (cytidine1402-2'-O)-methyltransferase